VAIATAASSRSVRWIIDVLLSDEKTGFSISDLNA
jgi:hypothetical protein